MTKKILAALAASATLLTLSACSTDAAPEPGADEGSLTIMVGTSNDAPFSTVEPDGSLSGIDGDMLMAMAEANGWTIETYVTDFSTLIPALTTKRIDLVVDAMYITDERKKQVNFTDPWYSAGEGIVVGDDNTDINGRDDLEGRKVGSVTGTVYAELAADLNPSEVVLFDDQATLIKAVENRQIEAAITDGVLVGYSLTQNPSQKIRLVDPYEPFFAGTIGAAVRKEDSDLLATLNKALADLKASPRYMEILESYGLTASNAEN